MAIAVTHKKITSGIVNTAVEVDLSAWNDSHVVTGAVGLADDNTLTGNNTFTNPNGITINVPGVTQFQLYHKTDQLLHPTATFRPTATNTAMTVDVCPNGIPTETIYAKYDICNGDVRTPGVLLNCLRGAVTATDVNIGSTTAVSGATPLPFNIKWNDNIAMQFTSGLCTWSYQQQIPTGAIGAPSISFTADPLTGIYGTASGVSVALNHAVAAFGLANVTASSTSNTTELDLQALTSVQMRAAGSIKANFTNVTDATRSGQMVLSVPNNGALTGYVTITPANTTVSNNLVGSAGMDATVIGAATPAAIKGTTITANAGFVGAGTGLTGTASGFTAGTVTTNANLTGDVTSVGNATTLTNAPVIAKVLTGYTSGAGTVTSTDSILAAFQKLNGNVGLKANLSGGNILSGTQVFSNLISAAGGQIAFPATQNPSSDPNTLDDYEEGTFTPGFTFATPGNLSNVFTEQAGFYTKIGNVCTVTIRMSFTPTFTTASGQCSITGLPFASGNIASNRSVGSMTYTNITKATYTSFIPRVDQNVSIITITASGSGVAGANVGTPDMTSGQGTVFTVTLSYMTPT